MNALTSKPQSPRELLILFSSLLCCAVAVGRALWGAAGGLFFYEEGTREAVFAPLPELQQHLQVFSLPWIPVVVDPFLGLISLDFEFEAIRNIAGPFDCLGCFCTDSFPGFIYTNT